MYVRNKLVHTYSKLFVDEKECALAANELCRQLGKPVANPELEKKSEVILPKKKIMMSLPNYKVRIEILVCFLFSGLWYNVFFKTKKVAIQKKKIALKLCVKNLKKLFKIVCIKRTHVRHAHV